MVAILCGFVVALAILCLPVGRMRAARLARETHAPFHSRPAYHGRWLALAVAVPALAVMALWGLVAPAILRALTVARLETMLAGLDANERQGIWRDAQQLAEGQGFGPADRLREEVAALLVRYDHVAMLLLVMAMVVAGAIGFVVGWRAIAPDFRARVRVEAAVRIALFAAAGLAVVVTAGIVLSLLAETLRFFAMVSPLDFLFGLTWTPQQAAFHAGQVAGKPAFGLLPLMAGTVLITLVALAVAAPVGVFAAIYLADYASGPARAVGKPVLEILAGIPTVVYGFFAALTVAPLIRNGGETLGLDVAAHSALAAGIVLGIMIVPLVSSLVDDVIHAVPQALRDASLGLGATKSETIRRVVLPAALPGIVSALVLAVSRAIGETMIVVMAAGMAARLTFNPLQSVTTVTVQITALLTGDQEFDTPKTLAAFALGLALFVVTLVLNLVALRVMKTYRQRHD